MDTRHKGFPLLALLVVASVFASGVFKPLVYAQTAFTNTSNLRGGNTPTIVRSGYDFGPSLMRDIDGKYKMWWCSGNIPQGKIDEIRYSEASSLAGPWSTPIVVLEGSGVSGAFDEDGVCSPSVIRVDGYYYMYFESGRFDSNGILITPGTAIGVVRSLDGISNWVRLNGNTPILLGRNWSSGLYGAGYPSVTYLDGWFYMLYFDNNGVDVDTGDGDANSTFLIRSNKPDFLSGNIQYWDGTAFAGYTNATDATGYGLQPSVNADLSYHRGLKEFMISWNGDMAQVLSHTAFHDRALLEIGFADTPNSLWNQSPGVLRDTYGQHPREIPDVSILYSFLENQFGTTCRIPLDNYRSLDIDNVPQEPPNADVSDLAYVGMDLTRSTPCGDQITRPPLDYDGDGASDPAIYLPSTQEFWIRRTTLGELQHQLGNSNSIPITGDFDGDDIADVGVATPTDLGGTTYLNWTIICSSGVCPCAGGGCSTGTYFQPTWGYPTDQIAIADYDGDTVDDIAVFRPGSGPDWWIVFQDGSTLTYDYGSFDVYLVAPGDYDGDGIADPSLYRPNNSTWYVKFAAGGFMTVPAGDIHSFPLPGDWNSDGLDDFTVYRTQNRKLRWTPFVGQQTGLIKV